MSKAISVAMANVGEMNISLDVVEKWNPEKVSFSGQIVFFKVDGTFFSMKKVDFCSIFPQKCGMLKY